MDSVGFDVTRDIKKWTEFDYVSRCYSRKNEVEAGYAVADRPNKMRTHSIISFNNGQSKRTLINLTVHYATLIKVDSTSDSDFLCREQIDVVRQLFFVFIWESLPSSLPIYRIDWSR